METKRRLADYKSPNYLKNFEYFDQYESDHREHQLAALFSSRLDDKGQIISPCGTGKTRIQLSLHIAEMIRLSNEYDRGVFAIASHRLSLNRELLSQIVDVAVNCGLPFDVVYIGSDRCDFSKYYTKYRHLGYKKENSKHLATTNSKEIEDFISESRENMRHVIIASTYDSFNKLKNVGTINLVTFDEAHNTTQNDFTSNIKDVKPNILKEYFFTATRKVAGETGGMNNENFYGKILIDISPKLMLNKGEIACPKLHIIQGENEEIAKSSNLDMIIKNTVEAFDRHSVFVKENSFDSNEIGTKLLIACNSIPEMIKIYNSNSLKAFANKNIKAFAISSDGSFTNWKSCSKEQFFIELNELSDTEDAIIFNVDMLTEGMDLPSITGVMPLRNLGQTKLIQLVGRALRLHKKDRAKLYSNEIDIGDFNNYIKPYGFLVIPRHLASINEYGSMIEMAKKFYTEYGTMAEELVILENFNANKPEDLDSVIPQDSKDSKKYDLAHHELSLIDEINSSIFNDEFNSAPNKLKYLEEILEL